MDVLNINNCILLNFIILMSSTGASIHNCDEYKFVFISSIQWMLMVFILVFFFCLYTFVTLIIRYVFCKQRFQVLCHWLIQSEKEKKKKQKTKRHQQYILTLSRFNLALYICCVLVSFYRSHRISWWVFFFFFYLYDEFIFSFKKRKKD